MKTLRGSALAFVLVFNSVICANSGSESSYEINTIWGEQYRIKDELLKKLLTCKASDRMKGIDQSGPLKYFGLYPSFNRFDHAAEILVLLDKIGCDRAECAAGFLHDHSYPAFSHLADYVYKSNNQEGYQDDIHLWALKRLGVSDITEQYGVTLEDLDTKKSCYCALERDLPDLCADRIQYNIYTGVLAKKISSQQAKEMVESLRYEDGKWFFTDAKVAEDFAMLPIYFTEHFWGSPWNCTLYHYFAKAIKRGFELGIVTVDEFHLGTDEKVLAKLRSSGDPEITQNLERCANIFDAFDLVAYGEGDFNTKPKCRAIDPLVLHEGKFQKLSEISPFFKASFERIRAWCKKGYGAKTRL